MGKEKIKVLIVDDSAVACQVLTKILSETNDIDVVGAAMNPLIARDKIKVLKPDVVTLDIEMPRMGGLTFMTDLMRLHPVPVVIVSTLTEEVSDATHRALELGAVDFIAKPKVKTELAKYANDICTKVRTAPKTRVSGASLTVNRVAKVDVPTSIKRRNDQQIIAIGSSTGGTEAIKEVLVDLPLDSPPVVVTQHISKSFSAAFAQRLDSLCQLTVVEADTGMELRSGHVYIAPGDRHLMIVKKGGNYTCLLNNGPEVNRHKPSVDVMFRSLLDSTPKDVHAVVLTGMGSDGAEGMLELLKAGATTTVQDEASSVVWGMPGSAVKLSAAQSVIPLKKMAGHLISQYE